MNSPVPAIFAVPVIVFVVAVAIGQFALLHRTTIDRLLNRSLAVPEIVLPASDSVTSDARLLRMTVEIRDALMHLHRYLPADRTRRGPPSNER